MKNLAIISKKVEISLDENTGEVVTNLLELKRTTTIRFLGILVYKCISTTTLD